jgi:hypothetical protein
VQLSVVYQVLGPAAAEMAGAWRVFVTPASSAIRSQNQTPPLLYVKLTPEINSLTWRLNLCRNVTSRLKSNTVSHLRFYMGQC